MAIGVAAEALLVITGSMGSGKTAVLDEASDILALRGIAHAGVDLDALLIAHFPSDIRDESVMYRNLRCVWENYAAQGVKRLLLARAIERREELNRIVDAVGAEKVTVCRLTASPETMEERVAQRDSGQLQGRYVARAGELNMLLDRAHLEDFSVVNERRAITDVAQEMLTRSGWI
jgi:type II secretory pathway predicted ATPase ExeA